MTFQLVVPTFDICNFISATKTVSQLRNADIRLLITFRIMPSCYS